jgi:hypothetical protein
VTVERAPSCRPRIPEADASEGEVIILTDVPYIRRAKGQQTGRLRSAPRCSGGGGGRPKSEMMHYDDCSASILEFA